MLSVIPGNTVTNYGYDIITQIQATKDGSVQSHPRLIGAAEEE